MSSLRKILSQLQVKEHTERPSFFSFRFMRSERLVKARRVWRYSLFAHKQYRLWQSRWTTRIPSLSPQQRRQQKQVVSSTYALSTTTRSRDAIVDFPWFLYVQTEGHLVDPKANIHPLFYPFVRFSKEGVCSTDLAHGMMVLRRTFLFFLSQSANHIVFFHHFDEWRKEFLALSRLVTISGHKGLHFGVEEDWMPGNLGKKRSRRWSFERVPFFADGMGGFLATRFQEQSQAREVQAEWFPVAAFLSVSQKEFFDYPILLQGKTSRWAEFLYNLFYLLWHGFVMEPQRRDWLRSTEAVTATDSFLLCDLEEKISKVFKKYQRYKSVQKQINKVLGRPLRLSNKETNKKFLGRSFSRNQKDSKKRSNKFLRRLSNYDEKKSK